MLWAVSSPEVIPVSPVVSGTVFGAYSPCVWWGVGWPTGQGLRHRHVRTNFLDSLEHEDIIHTGMARGTLVFFTPSNGVKELEDPVHKCRDRSGGDVCMRVHRWVRVCVCARACVCVHTLSSKTIKKKALRMYLRPWASLFPLLSVRFLVWQN